MAMPLAAFTEEEFRCPPLTSSTARAADFGVSGYFAPKRRSPIAFFFPSLPAKNLSHVAMAEYWLNYALIQQIASNHATSRSNQRQC